MLLRNYFHIWRLNWIRICYFFSFFSSAPFSCCFGAALNWPITEELNSSSTPRGQPPHFLTFIPAETRCGETATVRRLRLDSSLLVPRKVDSCGRVSAPRTAPELLPHKPSCPFANYRGREQRQRANKWHSCTDKTLYGIWGRRLTLKRQLDRVCCHRKRKQKQQAEP